MPQRELDGKIIGDDLCKLADIISHAGLCNDVGPLNNAGNFCAKNATSEEWKYKFDYLEFNIAAPSGCIPTECEDLKLRFSIDITGIIQDDQVLILNPLKELSFDLELIGKGYDFANGDILDLHSSWHLDKHIRGENDGQSKYSHPEYHLAFGGHKMESRANLYGTSLILPTPRLAYPPMDAVLGINFILQNYFHKDAIKNIVNNNEYKAIILNSQNMLMAPYAKSLISNWLDLGFKFEKHFDYSAIFPLIIN